jgi:hypothetical protein
MTLGHRKAQRKYQINTKVEESHLHVKEKGLKMKSTLPPPRSDLGCWPLEWGGYKFQIFKAPPVCGIHYGSSTN